MERLTEKNDELYFYPHCFEEECIGVSEPCSECEFEEKICIRLGEYEDTGLTPEQIRELKERDTAKIVNLIPFDGCDDDSDITYKAYCPICKRYIGILFKKGYKGKGDNFCRNCGQRLKWEE